MENKSIFDMFNNAPITIKISNRGFGKMYELQKTLTLLMTRYVFKVGRFKATTVIKFEKFDDVFVLYGDTLKKVYTITGMDSEKSLYMMAQEFQFIIENELKTR